MLRKTSVILVTAAVVGLAGNSAAVADHGELSGDAIKALLSDARGDGETFQGATYRIRYGADGSLKYQDVDGPDRPDQGTWTVEGDKYCSQWNRRNAGKKNCSIIKHTSGRRYLFVNTHDDRQIRMSIRK